MSDNGQDTPPENILPQPSLPGQNNQPIPQSLQDWMKGGLDKPPTEVENMMGSLVEKVNWSIAFMIVQQFGRVNNMLKYIDAAEAELFNPDTVADMDTEDLRGNYKEVTAKLNTFLEFTRKFVLQHKEILAAGVPEADKMAEVLRTLDPATIEALRKQVENEGVRVEERT